MRRTWLVLIAAAVSGSVLVAQSGYVPVRVFDDTRGQFGDFELMLADRRARRRVFVGEQHDDANTHRLELAVLEGLARRRGNVSCRSRCSSATCRSRALAVRGWCRSPRRTSSTRRVRGRTTRPTTSRSSTSRSPTTGPSSRPTCRGRSRRTSRSRGSTCSRRNRRTSRSWFASRSAMSDRRRLLQAVRGGDGRTSTSAPGADTSASAERQGVERLLLRRSASRTRRWASRWRRHGRPRPATASARSWCRSTARSTPTSRGHGCPYDAPPAGQTRGRRLRAAVDEPRSARSRQTPPGVSAPTISSTPSIGHLSLGMTSPEWRIAGDNDQ